MSAHTAKTELKLIGKLILEGEMHCETGLHIGAGKGSLEIGGADNPVVKDAFGRPYVPGSSLRGKLRSMLEQSSGLATPAELVYLSRRKGQEVRIHQSDRPDDEICLLFGRNPGRMDRVQGEAIDTNHASPARLTVYDAPLDPDSITPQMRVRSKRPLKVTHPAMAGAVGPPAARAARCPPAECPHNTVAATAGRCLRPSWPSQRTAASMLAQIRGTLNSGARG